MIAKKQSAYEEFLSSMHSKLITPDDVIREVIKTSTGQHLKTKSRIIAGEVSEVYDITLEDNTHIILRISREGRPNFLQEKWAIERVKKVGVPVPEILDIIYKTLNNVELSFCLMKKVDGEALERGSIDFDKLSEEKKKHYIHQAGDILSKIHSIKTDGFGVIYGEGKAEYESSDEIITDILGRRERMYKVAEKEKLERKYIENALDIVHSFKEQYRQSTSVLNHGDYGHKHFIVKENKIVAILDWGLVRSDSPVFDFASWDYWYGHYLPTGWLKEGYQDKSLFDNEFNRTVHTLRIIKGIEVIDWYYPQNYREGIERAIKKLLNDINYFK